MSKRKSKKIPAIAVMSTLAITALASSVSADTIIRNSTLNGLQVSSGASSAYIYAQGKDTRISNDVVIKAPTTLTANSDATNPFKDARVVIETNGTVTIGVPLKEVYINSNATIKLTGGGSIQRVVIASGKSPTLPPGIPGSVTQLATPSKPVVSGTKVSWGAIANATKYSVTIYNDKNVEVKTVSNVTTTSVDLSAQSLAAGTYTVKVKAIGNGSTYSDSALSSASGTVTIASPVTQLAAPSNLTVSGTKVSWGAVANATKYSVTIYNDKNAEVKTVSNVTTTSVDLSAQSLAAGTYTVKVKAIGNGSTYSDSALSSASSTVTIASPVTQLAAPSNLTVSGTKVSWDSVTNATKYAVTIYDDKNAEVKTVSDVATTSVDLSAQSLAAGTYTVKVKAIGNGTTYSDSALSSASGAVTIASPVTQLAAPSNLTVSGTKVSWDSVTNATKYAVTIYDDKNAEVKTVSNVATTSVDLSTQSLAAGTYTVKVKAIGNGTTYSDSALSAASGTVTIAAVDKSAATVGLEVAGDKKAGEAFNLSITGAKDKDGNALSKVAKIKVVANNGTSDTPVVNDQSFTFTNGAVKVPVTIGNVGTYTLKVTIEGVTGEKTVSNVTVKQ
ncbi:hypothetical protein [Aneurinibacillus migulanus]|uniref:hypothetical protein n=1 Tax=Aneurinibacillus migulanus TaxID=47500 RepID=UPI003D1FBC3E